MTAICSKTWIIQKIYIKHKYFNKYSYISVTMCKGFIIYIKILLLTFSVFQYKNTIK